ncbi:DUF3500 domain-containing protein [Zavarzinella formosa]|uniref:DUF3500 domain-containing protein n=1 Tax=Zavarzinella formosa TaxID=360055 RepID=UPI0012F87686|nr:DUF3500 domain-containing protein [Zavarzinella formosa]
MSETVQETPSHSRRKTLALIIGATFLGVALYALQSSRPESVAVADDPAGKAVNPARRAVDAANSFLDGLDPKLREKAVFEFDSTKKSTWSNLPVTIVQRNGIKLGDLSKEQRAKAMAVVAAVLSKEGYQKVIDIMDGDQKLTERGGKDGGKDKGGKAAPKGPMFGTDLYFLAIFGVPSETKPWMVQFGGHHLGVNVTIVGKKFVLTPTHTGAQPGLFKRGEMDVRPLGKEQDTAFKLVAALDEKQRPQAVIGERPTGELLLGPGRDGKTIEAKGIKGSALTAEQQALLLEVIGTWVNIVEADTAAARMTAIKEKIGETYFAWSGPVDQGKAAYFRVQGPNAIIEYAPQGGNDHIHTVYRNPEDEYGAGSIKP